MVYEPVVDFSARGPTRGQLHPVTHQGRVVMPRKPPPAPVTPYYDGEEGEVLRRQPTQHRKRWTEAQWLAYQEWKTLAGTTRRKREATTER